MIEIKPGYKQSDIGIFPEDWELKKFEKVLEKRSSKNYQIQTKEYLEYGRFPVVDQGKNKVIAYTDDKSKVYRNDENGVIVFGDHTCKTKFIDFDFVVGADGTQIIRSINNTITRFINYDLENTPIISTGYNRHFKKLKERLFICPKPEEQKAIANALDDVGKLIESLQELIKKKGDIKIAVMQELLTMKKRLPGFEGEWEEKKLKEVAPLQRGFDLTKSQIKEGNIPVAYSNGVMAYHSKAMVKGPGVYTGRSGTIGKVNFIASDYWPHNTSLWVTTFFKNDPKFIFYLYSFIGFDRFSSGSGVPTFNRNDAHDYICLLPQPSEQIAIAKILSDIDKEIDSIGQRLAKAKSLKKGMMQELLTGKTRLIKIYKYKETAP